MTAVPPLTYGFISLMGCDIATCALRYALFFGSGMVLFTLSAVDSTRMAKIREGPSYLALEVIQSLTAMRAWQYGRVHTV